MNLLLFLSKKLWIVNVSERVHVVPVRNGQRKVLRCQCNTDVTWYISSLTRHVATMSNQYAENTIILFALHLVWVKWLSARMLLYPSIAFKHREGGGGLEWINIGGMCLGNYVVFCSLSFFDTSLRLSFVNNDRNRSLSSSNILGNFCLFLVIIIFHTLTAQILTIFLISGINWMKRLNTWPLNLKQGIWESHFMATDPP